MAADTPTKLPVAPNINQVLNRISLGLAKHERILKTLNRPSPTTNSKSKSSSTGFSSLSGSSTPVPNPANTPKALSRADEEAEFAAERALAPNAGIGFAPVKEDSGNGRGGAKEDKMLRGRIMGKNAREQMSNKGKDKRRRYESESEEEEGRSGLGKKKKKVVAAVRAEPVEVEDVSKEEPRVEQEKTVDSKEKILDDDAVPEVKTEEPISMEATTPAIAAAAAIVSKNRKKKMRKAANKKAGKQQQDAENDTDMPDAPTVPLTEEGPERKRPAPDSAGEGAAEADGETADATDSKPVDATDSNSASTVGEKKARRKRGKKAKVSQEEADGDVAMEE